MLPPPKKVWNRFASKVISKLFPLRRTHRFLSRLGSDGRRCCRCSCHFHHQPEYWLQVPPRFVNRNSNFELYEDEEDADDDEEEELRVMEDEAVDEKAEEFIAKFHQSLKLERLQHV